MFGGFNLAEENEEGDLRAFPKDWNALWSSSQKQRMQTTVGARGRGDDEGRR